MVHSLVLPLHLVVPLWQQGAGMKYGRNRRPGDERIMLVMHNMDDREVRRTTQEDTIQLQ